MYLDTVWTVFITPDSNDFQYMDQNKKKSHRRDSYKSSLDQHECEYMMTAFSFCVNCPTFEASI